ncbi:V-type ATP synthase subunit D [Synechococcus sp. BA-124 BA4]|uniref:V-type ATP synthase subunit D n=1 Tax=unclassified Synechococcus TaxID=2626047 RepID=UPI0018CD68EE|nr:MULTISPECIES: V-type ATP synthase subunit D [unclassified Synechococcus]MEA5400902.1 V-type ATP synthase subunit D [Synechococcus sp. BA-124 BA4]QPN56967.1 V-type ATP synthase subunit D [Synechococcus sp. CBW1107]CAK6695057.1 V-type ATP synthase subunit D [Synechococcus sp. CBW1107]
MSRLPLTKASLSRQKGLLKTYHDVLPSLDLKRRQLGAEREAARRQLEQARARAAEITAEVGKSCPMLAHERIDLSGLVTIAAVHQVQENLMGTRLPKLERIDFRVADYGLLTRPFWVDAVVEWLQEAMRNQLQLQVAEHRLELLRQAERKVTQRFNLFDKVLIPGTRRKIKTISIYLADAERAGVVNSKIAKRKKQHSSAEAS